MSRLMTVAWVVQFFILLGLSIVGLVWPSAVMYFVHECVPADVACADLAPSDTSSASVGPAPSPDCSPQRGLCPSDPHATPAAAAAPPLPGAAAPDCEHRCVLVRSDPETQALYAVIRLLAPFFVTFAMFSAHAAMRADERIRRNLAFIFAGIFLVLGVLLYTDNFSDVGVQTREFKWLALLCAVVALLVFSIYSAIRAHDTSRRAAALLAALGYGLLLLFPLPTVFAAMDWKLPQGMSEVRLQGLGVGAVLLLDTLAGDIERTRARMFAVVLLFPLVLFGVDLGSTTSNAMSDEPTVMRALLAGILVCVLLNAQYAVWPVEDAERRLSGCANTRPSSLWLLWLFQGLAFTGLSVGLVLAHSAGDSVFLKSWPDRGYAMLFVELDELYVAFFTAIGVFSFSGMQVSREWVWKAYCLIFSVFYGTLALSIVFVWSLQVFRPWVLAATVPLVLLSVVHAVYYRSRSEWFSEDVGEGSDGWIPADLLLGPLFMLRSIWSRRRATHARGVAAEGTMRVAAANFPKHEMFRPGPDMHVHIRFSNERSTDDAAVDARGAAVCLVAADGTRFDLTMSTGAFGAAANIVELGLVWVVTGMGEIGRSLLARSRQFLEGGIACLRRAPSSYADLTYHSQSVRFWVATDNSRYLVRYRLCPADPAQEETGLPITARDYVKRGRAPGERRPTDYLRRELKLRLQGPAKALLKLQAQFHKVDPADGVEWYSPAVDWHAGRHPWIDIGDITLESALSDAGSERLVFSTHNAPGSLGVPASMGMFDPRSIADCEKRVMRRVQALRAWLVDVIGLPRSSPIPVK